jgi:5-methylcytosine-specific restriction enzyme subunit McrC
MVHELQEYKPLLLERNSFSEENALSLHRRFSQKVSVAWPSPITNYQWELRSLGWVGYIPLDDCGLSLQPKVSIGNLFRMLEYEYDLKAFHLLEGQFDADSMRDFYERLAGILARRLMERARNGLYKTYIGESDIISFIRGRMDMAQLMRSPVKSRVLCHYEDHTMDVVDNRIMAWTLFRIANSGLCTGKTAGLIGKADHLLRNTVTLMPFFAVDCACRTYSRLNSDYEIMHKLCRFFLENTGPTHETGDRSMLPFLLDMSSLYESFVARWLKAHLDPRYTLSIQENRVIGVNNELRMVMDLLIRDAATNEPICVLDTKYKAAESVGNDDFYQVVTYANTVGCESAILVYPIALKQRFDATSGDISVRSAAFDIGGDLDACGRALLEEVYALLDRAGRGN